MLQNPIHLKIIQSNPVRFVSVQLAYLDRWQWRKWTFNDIRISNRNRLKSSKHSFCKYTKIIGSMNPRNVFDDSSNTVPCTTVFPSFWTFSNKLSFIGLDRWISGTLSTPMRRSYHDIVFPKCLNSNKFIRKPTYAAKRLT